MLHKTKKLFVFFALLILTLAEITLANTPGKLLSLIGVPWRLLVEPDVGEFSTLLTLRVKMELKRGSLTLSARRGGRFQRVFSREYPLKSRLSRKKAR